MVIGSSGVQVWREVCVCVFVLSSPRTIFVDRYLYVTGATVTHLCLTGFLSIWMSLTFLCGLCEHREPSSVTVSSRQGPEEIKKHLSFKYVSKILFLNSLRRTDWNRNLSDLRVSPHMRKKIRVWNISQVKKESVLCFSVLSSVLFSSTGVHPVSSFLWCI